MLTISLTFSPHRLAVLTDRKQSLTGQLMKSAKSVIMVQHTVTVL